jgi:hypothetical protein
MNPTHHDLHRLLTDAVWTGDAPQPGSKAAQHSGSGASANGGTAQPPLMIQMQTYTRKIPARSSSKNRASTQAMAMDVYEAPEFPLLPRQREPRENSDFLRVIVLEMNMRRSGKLDAKSAGHARVWLPPRKCLALGRARGVSSKEVIPERWVGVSVEEI